MFHVFSRWPAGWFGLEGIGTSCSFPEGPNIETLGNMFCPGKKS